MNPKFNKFLAENPNITMLGIGWALLWRLYGALLGICLMIGILAALFD